MVGILRKKEKINIEAYENIMLRNVHFFIFHPQLRLSFYLIRNCFNGKVYRVKAIATVFRLSQNQPIILTYFYIFYFIAPKFTKIFGV